MDTAGNPPSSDVPAADLYRGALEVLDRPTCLALLRDPPVHLGRIGMTVDGQPLVLPVNYAVDGEAVVFRTDPGSKLDVAVQAAPVAFEVDAVDPAWEEGWSVVVQGRAELVTASEELSRIRRLPLRPWASGRHAHVVRIPIERISGRRIS